MPKVDIPEFIASTLPLPQQWSGRIIWRPDLKVHQVSDGLTWSVIGASAVSGYGNRKLQGARVLSTNMSATAGTSAGSTWNIECALPVKFSALAILLASVETGAITVTSGAVAAASTMSTYPNSSATWSQVTWNGATTVNLPVRAASGQPSFTVSDFIPVQALEPVDGSGLYYACARVYFAGTGYSYVGLSAGVSTALSKFSNMAWKATDQVVDGVTTPANFSANGDSTNHVIVGVLYLSDSGSLGFMGVGDSTVHGVNSTTGAAGAITYLPGLLPNLTSRVTPINAGNPGKTPAVYLANAKRLIAAFKPSVAIYRVSSANESCNSQAIADKHYALALDFVNYCWQNGVLPVLESSMPQNLGSVSADQYRQALHARVASFCNTYNIPYIDANAAVADPAVPWQFLAAYNSGDNSHPNDAGYAAIAAAEAAVLSRRGL